MNTHHARLIAQALKARKKTRTTLALLGPSDDAELERLKRLLSKYDSKYDRVLAVLTEDA